jgi:heme A synthase
LLGVLLQAVWAGEFIERVEKEPWLTVHEIGGFVVVVLALVTVVAAVLVRNGMIITGAAGLLVLIVFQTALGELITKAGADGLIVAHVPIAMLIFGLGIYLSSAGARLRRSLAS